ncbi:Uncharacterized protein conserved in bacteria (DUF2076) [Bordetella ansorpii]|uniref:Uncharacterized protein conserved in bacteria (DUF2076) n=1 Tax=Bordetella ansorpii TaxID=288768 RepID=A0A157SWK9_9BORD|nr:DUF2076 family protein [Bordetella ansorpii]SAI74868.1 Uncharacterized protein conserved in bacteria (DUF2076) [Bordetella ansorpii]
MNQQDRDAIESIFTRLQEVERQGAPRDGEAERYIGDRLAAQPGSAYYLAQTVMVQEQALKAAQQRIAQLEGAQQGQPQGQGGDSARGFAPLGGAQGFGRNVGALGERGGATPGTGFGGAPGAAAPAAPASGLSAGFGRSAGGGGGFLAGAMQTAVGVAGGMMLGSLLGGMFGGNDAHAAQPPADPAPDAAADDAASDPSSGYDDGGFDDGGGFDDI